MRSLSSGPWAACLEEAGRLRLILASWLLDLKRWAPGSRPYTIAAYNVRKYRNDVEQSIAASRQYRSPLDSLERAERLNFVTNVEVNLELAA